MKTIMSKSSLDSSFSFSRRYLHWKKTTVSSSELDHDGGDDDGQHFLTFNNPRSPPQQNAIRRSVSFDTPARNKKQQHPVSLSVSKLRSALSLGKTRPDKPGRVTGTIFGRKRGNVQFAVQADPDSKPTFLIELAIPTGALVREMASGLARIALECEKSAEKKRSNKKKKKLEEETIWKTYCNGKKYGSGNRFDCGEEEWRVLKSIGKITVGAGVIMEDENELLGEVMYVRAGFERVISSKNSEAFYMINPDGIGGSELSIFLRRV